MCSDGTPEDGFEKIAIYATGPSNTKPSHAARQLANGKWTSKLGQVEDIEHDTVTAIEGPLYGLVVRYLKRQLTSPTI